MKRLIFGFKNYFLGLSFWCNNPALLKISIIPVFVDAVFFGMGLYIGFSRFNWLMAKTGLTASGFWSGILYYSVAFFVSMAILLFVVLLVLIVANLVAFPFHDMLSEKTLRLTGKLPESDEKSLTQKGKLLVHNSFVALRKAVLFTTLAVFLFIAGFIPVVNVVATLTGFLILSYDFTDYSFDHIGLNFRARLGFFLSHLPEFLGFALALGLTLAIPVINFIAIPGSIVSASRMFARLHK